MQIMNLKGHDVIELQSRHWSGGNEENHKHSVSTSDVTAEIRTEALSNKNPMFYRYTNPLSTSEICAFLQKFTFFIYTVCVIT
jgi:hypothetical protein